MSKRKTAIRTDNETENRAEYKRVSAIDRVAKEVGIDQRSLLPTLAEWRAERGCIESRELIAQARLAARLEMRGASYGADDRAEVAAEIVRRIMLDTGGALPPKSSPKIQLPALCGMARNLRDSLDRLRARDRADERRAAEDYALSEIALGVDHTPARHAAILARTSETLAHSAVSAVLDLLGVTDDVDGPIWLTLYQWVTGETSEVCAERRGISHSLMRKRTMIGARFLREFFSPDELVSKLTAGALATRTVGMAPADSHEIIGGSGATYTVALDYGDTVAEPADILTFTLEDRSREAPHPSKMLATVSGAPHWREGTDNGQRPERPENAAQALSACNVRKLAKAERVHWTKQRARRPERDQETAQALRRLARAHALGSRRREPGTQANSALTRAIAGNA